MNAIYVPILNCCYIKNVDSSFNLYIVPFTNIISYFNYNCNPIVKSINQVSMTTVKAITNLTVMAVVTTVKATTKSGQSGYVYLEKNFCQ